MNSVADTTRRHTIGSLEVVCGDPDDMSPNILKIADYAVQDELDASVNNVILAKSDLATCATPYRSVRTANGGR